jgi:hypothetical protein
MKVIIDQYIETPVGIEIGYWLENQRSTKTIPFDQPRPNLGDTFEIEDPIPSKKEQAVTKIKPAQESAG